VAASIPVWRIGKIEDLFAGRGITRGIHTVSDEDGMDQVVAQMQTADRGLIFTNLVDFDAQYGPSQRRRRLRRQSGALSTRGWPLCPPCSRVSERRDMLVVTADTCNDPTTPSTGPTSGSNVAACLVRRRALCAAGHNLGTRETFADLGQSLADVFGVGPLSHGNSFLSQITTVKRRNR